MYWIYNVAEHLQEFAADGFVPGISSLGARGKSLEACEWEFEGDKGSGAEWIT